jgi:hypothetical protein
MDRRIVYPGQIPLETDLLFTAKASAVGLAQLTAAVFGNNSLVTGMAVTPTSPASLRVQVEPGALYAPLPIDATSYGSLGADSDQMVVQGLLLDSQVLTLVPPTTSGRSQVFLIQASCQVVDTDPTVLPYYNADNPDLAFTGPGNSGTPQNTTRAVRAVISIKAGTSAPTGSQVAPAPDAGNIPLSEVTLANGATSITSANIKASNTTPRLFYLLQQLAAANAAIVDAAGLVRDPSNGAQILAAMRGLFGGTGSLAPNGYMRLPGGAVLQWGASTSSGTGQTNVLFPVGFPTRVNSVVVTEQNAGGWGSPPQPTVFGASLADQAGFVAYSARVQSNGVPVYQAGLAFNWMAIGY